jgi:hypothetical protein
MKLLKEMRKSLTTP